MVEPLTEREIEILQLAANGCANGEIAARLSLTLNTVKWYCKRIYEKLEVANRTQAIQRAKTLGLLAGGNGQAKSAPHYNLPNPLTAFVGRRAEVDAVKQLLGQNRLLTLTGPGGIGKTRLSLQVAEEMTGHFQDGVCFVDLSSVNEATLVTNTIAHVLGVAESLDTPLATLIQAALHNKHLLLVLDNFEHLLEAAPLVTELLGACRGLTVLITSREVLALYGEQEFTVPPLKLPDLEWFATGHLAPGTLVASEASQLFERCAQAVYPDFRLTAENASAVSRICLRLDGLPLAIELAAAYIKLLSPQAILTQLDSLWLEMKRSLRNVPARQQTLRNTIEWSYRLLNAEERQLFAQLAVFRGGCTWEAIEAICDHHATGTLLEHLSALVNKSLVWRRADRNDQPRFGMLETIREYALICLHARGEVATLQERHAVFYSGFTKRVETELMGLKQRLVLNQLENEVDNFRAALRWTLDHDPEPGLSMIGNLGSCWRIRGYLTEGMGWAQQLLATGQGASADVQARAYASTAILALILGHRSQARQLAEQGWQLTQQVDDRLTRWQAIHARVTTSLAPNLPAAEYEEITRLINEAALLYPKHEPPYAEYEHLRNYARTLNMFGQVKRVQKRYDEAKEYFLACLQGARAAGYQSGVATAMMNLGWTVFHMGNYAEALTHFTESLNLSYELSFPHAIAMALLGMSGALARLQHAQQAAKLLGAVDAIQASIGIIMAQNHEPDYTRTYAELQAILGSEDFDHYWQVGRTMTVAAATTFANQCNRDSAILPLAR